MTVAAHASRAQLEAFFTRAEARLTELEALIDDGYQRLAPRKSAAWEGIEGLEVEREEIILRVDEAFAMLEHGTDDEGNDIDSVEEFRFIQECDRNPRAPLPHGWEWPRADQRHLFDRELTEAERKAQGWPDSREETRREWAATAYRFGARVA